MLLLAQNIILVSVILIAILTVAVMGYLFSKKQVVLRKLKKYKNRRISQIRSNELTKITGKTLHVHEPLIAPFSKRKCVAYLIKISQKKSSGKSSYWKTLVKEEKIQDFFLKDSSGEVIMVKPTSNPRNYDGYLVKDRSVSSGMFNDPTPEFESLLSQYNINSTSFLGFNKKLRYTERIIEVGEEITVGGIAKWKTITEPIDNYSYSKIAALESSNSQKILITDHPDAKPDRTKLR
jgi:hypothetical protein